MTFPYLVHIKGCDFVPQFLLVRLRQVQKEEESSELDSCDDKMSQQTQDASSLLRIWPMSEYFLWKFRSVYSPKQELSLGEATTPWRCCLKFRTYNLGKLTNHGVLVRIVCGAISGYVCKMERSRSWSMQYYQF